MKKKNIKEKIKASGFYQYQVAEAMNPPLNEWTFMRWLRHPEKLSREQIDLINAALLKLKKERKGMK